MKRRLSLVVPFAAVFGIFAQFGSPCVALAQDYFRIVPLGSLQPQVPAGTFRAFRVNENGLVVGKIPSGSQFSFTQAASWQNGVLKPLGYAPGGSSSYAVDSNTASVVAGQTLDAPGNPLASVLINGVWDSLRYPGGAASGWTSANGINTAARVVGYYTSRSLDGGPGGRAFYHPGYDGNTAPTLLTLPSPYAWSDAFEINDNNLIAGALYGTSTADRSVAVIWNTTGGYQILGPGILDSGYFPTSAQSINNSNIAVGSAIIGTAQYAVYWDSNAGTHPVVDAQNNYVPGVANAISNTNFIVGSTVQASTSTDSRAWLKAPMFTDLYDLSALQPDTSLKLYTASDVNASLQIVGISSAGGYMATPVAYRTASGAWNSASQWLWSLQPTAVHPVNLSGNSAALTVTGPTSPATVSELNIGNTAAAASTLSLAVGQTLSVTANAFGNGTATIRATGTLSVDGTLNAPVQLGGLLAGTGTVNGTLTVAAGGNVSPGHSAGMLTINGTASFVASSRLTMEINGTNAGTTYDQLAVSGETNLGGATLSLSGTYTPAVGESFLIINRTGASAVTGTFAGLPEGALCKLNGRDMVITYVGGNGNDVVLTALSPIQAFRQQYFGTYFNAGDAADTADSDHDGLTNLVEFGFGMNPIQGQIGPLQYTGTFAGGGTISQTGLPTLRFESNSSGAEVRGLFIRRNDYAAAGISYVPQFSDDLTTWQDNIATPFVLADNGTYELVSVPLPTGSSVQARRFFRVQLTLTP